MRAGRVGHIKIVIVYARDIIPDKIRISRRSHDCNFVIFFHEFFDDDLKVNNKAYILL